MTLNTLDHLGKLDAKEDEGYFLVVVARTSSTNISGTKDVASQAVKKDVSSLRYITLPNWFHEAHMETSNVTIKNSDAQDDSIKEQDCDADVPKSSGISNPTATSKVPLADQVEPTVSLTVESKILTVSSLAPTVCLDISPKSSSADLSNMETSIPVSPTPTFKIHKDHPKSQIIGPVDTPVQTRYKSKDIGEQSFIATIHQKKNPKLLSFCLFSCFLSQEEPKKIFDALKDLSWVEAMQEELIQFKIQNVWVLVDCLKRGIEDGIDYEEVFAPVAKIKAIRLFLAYASFMGFIVYQMNVKSAFLYGTIDEEVYVMQPPRFQDPEFPERVYKTIVATSTTKAEYMAGASGCGQVLWIQNHMLDIGRHLKLNDEEGISSLPDSKLFKNLSLMGYNILPNQSNIATAVVCLATNRVYNFSKMIFDDEHASLSRDDRHGEAFPTISSLDAGQDRENIAKTYAMSYESSPRVPSLDADEGNMQQRLHKLMELCTSLQRQQPQMPIQEDAPITGGIIDIGEELEADKSTEKGSNDTEEMVNVLSSMEAANIL
uniref:Reverse transcriptase Ty1/copia-type domain-containing protein n=1 Tax=Tanacetum cinerariifolium TaxID=118510 RepID=A0A699IBI6_TANCI|nr:hypothetical protein [Tanacetum cinerariifolium]